MVGGLAAQGTWLVVPRAPPERLGALAPPGRLDSGRRCPVRTYVCFRGSAFQGSQGFRESGLKGPALQSYFVRTYVRANVFTYVRAFVVVVVVVVAVVVMVLVVLELELLLVFVLVLVLVLILMLMLALVLVI